jgi:hypothetical protein
VVKRRPGAARSLAFESAGALLSFTEMRRRFSEKAKGSFCHTLGKFVSFVGEILSFGRPFG